MKLHYCCPVFGLILASVVFAQQPLDGPRPMPGPGDGGSSGRMSDPGPPPPFRPSRSPLERRLQGGSRAGRWWHNPDLAKQLAITDAQQKKMDDIFQQSRLKLIDRSAALQKEEVILEPLLSADPPQESAILSQIDRIAQARAELEKANARMLLGIRSILTHDQWEQLQKLGPPRRDDSSRRRRSDERAEPTPPQPRGEAR